ncbi:RTA1 like protein-domain-containing protein [Mycena haematopus]|nr:RTA1 like protein-domain-containing protein [Mycena haematopus]
MSPSFSPYEALYTRVLPTHAAVNTFSPYGYTPTEYVCILYVALFALSTILHIGQATHYRLWWLFPSVIFAGVLETLGWAGRLWSSQEPHMFQAYEMQIVCTIMGPTPLAAANFIILGRIINLLSPGYSRMSPKLYMIVFLSCDVISLVIQAIGGGMAATAVNQRKNPNLGGNVMLGGIVLQMVAISVFVLCASEFLLRYLNNRPLVPSSKTQVPLSPKIKLFVCALGLTTTCLFIRAVYRVIELSDGWTGRIIHTQVYFSASLTFLHHFFLGPSFVFLSLVSEIELYRDAAHHLHNFFLKLILFHTNNFFADVLDGAMITLAMFTLNIAHPGVFLAAPTVGKDAETDAYGLVGIGGNEARNHHQNWAGDAKQVLE